MGNSKTKHENILTQNRVIKNIMIYKLKVELQERIKKIKRERKRENTFSRKNVRENNKFIENKIKIKRVKIKYIIM